MSGTVSFLTSWRNLLEKASIMLILSVFYFNFWLGMLGDVG